MHLLNSVEKTEAFMADIANAFWLCSAEEGLRSRVSRAVNEAECLLCFSAIQ